MKTANKYNISYVSIFFSPISVMRVGVFYRDQSVLYRRAVDQRIRPRGGNKLPQPPPQGTQLPRLTYFPNDNFSHSTAFLLEYVGTPFIARSQGMFDTCKYQQVHAHVINFEHCFIEASFIYLSIHLFISNIQYYCTVLEAKVMRLMGPHTIEALRYHTGQYTTPPGHELSISGRLLISASLPTHPPRHQSFPVKTPYLPPGFVFRTVPYSEFTFDT